MKKINLRRGCIACLLFGLLLLISTEIGNIDRSSDQTCAMRLWSYAGNGWTGTVELPFRLQIGREETGSLTAFLPQTIQDGNVLCLFTSKQQLLVRVDGKIVYSRENDTYPENACGSLHFVPLHRTDAGKPIELTVHNCFVRLPNTFEPVYVGSMRQTLNSLWADCLVPLVLTAMIFLVGVISTVLSIYYKSPHEARSIRMNGCFLLALAAWSLAQIPVTYLFPIRHILFVLEQSALLIMPILIVLAIWPLDRPLILKWECASFCILFCLYFLVSVILNALHVTALPDVSIWSLLFFGIFMVYLCVFGVLESSLDSVFSQQQRVLASGILINVVLCALLFGCMAAGFSFCGVRLAVYMISGLVLLGIAFLTFWEMRVLLQIQNELAQSRMTLLLSQIKPHFLYNTLNSIRTLIRTDAECADDLVYNFSRFLRNNMHSINSKEFIPFVQELEHIKSYVNIEKTCFPKLEVIFDIRIQNFSVPPLTIQPLVENAIKHGVLKKTAGGTVKLSTWEETDGYCVEIWDNGVGFSVNQVLESSDGNGLKNVTMRLKYSCSADLKVHSQPGEGCTIFVKIPKRKERRRKDEDHFSR